MTHGKDTDFYLLNKIDKNLLFDIKRWYFYVISKRSCGNKQMCTITNKEVYYYHAVL